MRAIVSRPSTSENRFFPSLIALAVTGVVCRAMAGIENRLCRLTVSSLRLGVTGGLDNGELTLLSTMWEEADGEPAMNSSEVANSVSLSATSDGLGSSISGSDDHRASEIDVADKRLCCEFPRMTGGLAKLVDVLGLLLI